MPPTSTGRPVEPLERRTLLSITPAGFEFPVNTYTPSHQVSARAAMAEDGSFVVVWSSLNQATPESAQDIYARRFDADGDPLTGEMLVNVYTTGHQSVPAVAMDEAGNFVVAWASYLQDGEASGVYARRYDAAAQPVSGEFRVNTYTGADESFPSVAMDADGDFIVTWDTHNPGGGGDLYDVYAQRYSAQGQPIGGEMRINSTLAGHQYGSSIAMDIDGDFVVTWLDDRHDGSAHGIYARRFNALGQAQGLDFRVNTFTTGNQLFPYAAMDADGDFVIVWQSAEQDGSDTGIVGRRYNSAGAPLGGEFLINDYTTGMQEGPSVSMDDAGNFVVVWESFGPDGSRLGVRGRAYRSSGAAMGGEFGINANVVDDQAFANVSVDPDGDTVVVWQSRYQDGSENGIFAQRYRLDGIGPTVTASQFRYQTAPHQLRFTFDENVSASLSSGDLTVANLAGGPSIPAFFSDYDTATNTATFTFPSLLSDGRYRAALAASGISDASGNPMAANHGFDFFFLTADANHDARVNLQDFNVVAANFGRTNRDYTQGDFTYDGTVNLSDFNLLASRFGTILAAPSGSTTGSSEDDDEASARLADDLLT